MQIYLHEKKVHLRSITEEVVGVRNVPCQRKQWRKKDVGELDQ